jgi:glycosyltransferase involved in cell wall biosynthesis
LFCSPVLPEFDRESGSKRVWDLIEFLLADGWAVTFVGRQSAVPRYVQALQDRGVCVWCDVAKPNENLIAHGRFDLAVLAFWYVAEDYLPVIRKCSPRTKILIDSVDLHFVRYARRAFLRTVNDGLGPTGSLDRNYADEMQRELNVYAASDGVMTVSAKEASLLEDLLGDAAPMSAVPDAEDLELDATPFAERRGILFVGNFRHAPNVDAVKFLCGEVWPRIDPTLRKAHPLSVVGNAPNGAVKEAVASVPNARLVGWVPEVLPYLSQSRISVVPLKYGAGTKRKLLQSVLMGTPAVSTRVGVEGLELVDGEHVLVADAADSFASAVTQLATEEALWQRLSRAGRAAVAARHSRSTAQAAFAATVDAVLRRPTKCIATASHTPYARIVAEIPKHVASVAQTGAGVAVISKGDEQLLDKLRLVGMQPEHFPQDDEGNYAGHHLGTSQEAIDQLESLRCRGVNFLVVPSTSDWWLVHYQTFADHLRACGREVTISDDVALIFDFRSPCNTVALSGVADT